MKKYLFLFLAILFLITGCEKEQKVLLIDQYDNLSDKIKEYLDIEYYPTYQGKNVEAKVLSSCSLRDYFNIDYYFYEIYLAPIYLEDTFQIEEIELKTTISGGNSLLAETNSILSGFACNEDNTGIMCLSFYIKNGDVSSNKILDDDIAYQIACNLEISLNYNGKKETIKLEDIEVEPYLDNDIEMNRSLARYLVGKEEITFGIVE